MSLKVSISQTLGKTVVSTAESKVSRMDRLFFPEYMYSVGTVLNDFDWHCCGSRIFIPGTNFFISSWNLYFRQKKMRKKFWCQVLKKISFNRQRSEELSTQKILLSSQEMKTGSGILIKLFIESGSGSRPRFIVTYCNKNNI
jgi:hypothetical protein